MLVNSVLDNSTVSNLVAPWLVAYSVATVVSLMNLYLKVKVLIEQFRNRRAEFDITEEESKLAATLQKHETRLVKTRRHLRLIYASLMVGVGEV